MTTEQPLVAMLNHGNQNFLCNVEITRSALLFIPFFWIVFRLDFLHLRIVYKGTALRELIFSFPFKRWLTSYNPMSINSDWTMNWINYYKSWTSELYQKIYKTRVLPFKMNTHLAGCRSNCNKKKWKQAKEKLVFLEIMYKSDSCIY